MKKRGWIIGLCMCLVVTMMPTVAFADVFSGTESEQVSQMQENDADLSAEDVTKEDISAAKAYAAESPETVGEEVPEIKEATPDEEVSGGKEETENVSDKTAKEAGTESVSEVSSPAKMAVDPNFRLSHTAVSLSVTKPSFTITVYGLDLDDAYVHISNYSVADYETHWINSTTFTITVTRVASGTTTLYVENDDWYDDYYYGDTRTCKITCGKEPFKLSTKKIVFGKNFASSYGYINSVHVDYAHKDSTIKSARSSKKKVASVKVVNTYGAPYVLVTPKKKGKTVITVTDTLGRKQKVKVTVKQSWFKANLKQCSYCYLNYGSKKARVYSKPGAIVTIAIGGRYFSKRIPKSGSSVMNLEGTEINVKQIYKLNTKYAVKYQYNNISYLDNTKKIESNTYGWSGTMYSCEYTIPVTVYNVTKGDTVFLKVAGNVYKKKINYSSEKVSLTFTTSTQNRYISALDIVIKNKFKQKLYEKHENIYWR